MRSLEHSSVCSEERNLLEALSAGASASVAIVANIAVNLIAFMALLAFTDDVIGWLGHFVGYPDISFQVNDSKLHSHRQ